MLQFWSVGFPGSAKHGACGVYGSELHMESFGNWLINLAISIRWSVRAQAKRITINFIYLLAPTTLYRILARCLRSFVYKLTRKRLCVPTYVAVLSPLAGTRTICSRCECRRNTTTGRSQLEQTPVYLAKYNYSGSQIQQAFCSCTLRKRV
jgi:hypothetical protein